MATLANPISALNTAPSPFRMIPKSPTADSTRIGLGLHYHGVHEAIPFPWKIHQILEEAVVHDFTNIVSWLPDHCSFRVHHREAFVKRVMQHYFHQTKYKSFQRQLNMWGFERILSGPYKGGYTHTDLVRGQPALCHRMTRVKIKGIGNKSAAPIGPTPAIPPGVRATCLDQSLDEDVLFDGDTLLSVLSSAIENNQDTPAPDAALKGMHFFGNTGPGLEQSIEEQFLCDEKTLMSVLSSAIDNIPDDTVPEEGDCVLFEGMKFFFVEDYNDDDKTLPVNTPRSPRRLSIEFHGGSSGGRRRMSLVGGMGYGSSNANRRLSIEPLMPTEAWPSTSQQQPMAKRRRAGRRFSLERGRGGPRDFSNFILKEM